MNELKTCPFCGSDDVSALDDAGYLHGDRFPFAIACHDCGAYGSSERTARLAIEAWNTRAECENCAALNKADGLWAKADKMARDLERTCHMSSSDYHPCAEDDCMRLKVRMWTCSECEADYVGNKPNYCPNCGAKVVSE